MNRYFGTHTLGGEWHALLPRYQLLAQRVRGRRVLDIGCGTGIGSSLLLEMGAESVHGVDHRPEVVELARIKHDKPGLSFHVMLWESLEFDDDSFDMVVCLDPSSPVTDRNLLVEVRRVLRPQGEYICAVERTKIAGLETLLPRYGYSNPSNQVSINQSSDRVPQIGALGSYFDSIRNIIQRPSLGYIFEPDAHTTPQARTTSGQEALGESNSPGADGHLSSALRRVPDDSGGGLWHADPTDPPVPPFDGPGQWISVDRDLNLDDARAGGVEIFFCGDAHLPPPPLKEIRLPYHNVVERLGQVVEDLQSRQSLGGEVSSFDEVLDSPDALSGDSLADTRATQEFGGAPAWDQAPTGVHRQPLPPATDAALARQQEGHNLGIKPQSDHITAEYNQMRRQIDALEQMSRAALAERDAYIDHLVRTIHALESQAGAPAEAARAQPAEVWQQETTNVFKIATLGSQDRADSVRDDLAQDQIADEAEPDSLEHEIASLYDERVRIDALLAAREARLDELNSKQSAAAPDHADSSAAEAANPPGDAPSDPAQADSQTTADSAQDPDDSASTLDSPPPENPEP